MAAAATAALCATAPAMAQSTTVNMKVLADLTINDVCDVNSGANAEQTRISFGTVDPDNSADVIGSNSAARGGVGLTITCNQVISNATFEVSKGSNDDGTVRTLIRTGPGDQPTVAYELFLGDTTSGPRLDPGSPRPVTGTVANGSTTFVIPITGRIAGTDVTGKAEGTYTDAANGFLVF